MSMGGRKAMYYNVEQLDLPRFRKVWALTNSPNKGEALAAKRAAKRMLKEVGKVEADVPGLLADHPVPPTFNIFAGFDDHMEAKEPGWKAKQADQRARQAHAEAEERRAVIARYGTEEDATAPTPMEKAVNAAAAPFERTIQKEYSNGTFPAETLDGWDDAYKLDEMPAGARGAIEGALPLPTTIKAAAAEYNLWEARDRELGLIYCNLGNTQLSLPCEARREIVRRLLETGLRATSLADVLCRQRYAVNAEWHTPEIEKAVLADLEALAEADDAL